MAHYADIPDELLDRDKSQDFVDWVLTLPIPTHERAAFGYLWQKATTNRLTKIQWRSFHESPRLFPDG